jgi:polysaccharide biosynthesis/export protein
VYNDRSVYLDPDSGVARKEFARVVARSFVPLLTLLVSLGLSTGWAQKPAAPAAPPSQNGAAPGSPGAPAAGATAAVDPRTYEIGAEDVLFIRVWREADFTSQYVVRPDGKITVPLIGDVQAAGLTPERLGDQLKQALSEYINSPDVSVSLQQVNSKKFFITGEVNRAGEFPLVVPTRIFDALSNAGGFRDFANKKKIIVIRGSERLKFNYQDILKGKNLEQNIFLENGDTIVVP